jgi:phosphoglycerol transferase MdoB-like AlkP superfamily enzyme
MNFRTFLSHQLALIKRIGFILLLFTVTRILFFLLNFSVFRPLDLKLILKSFFFGLRFDFISIYYFNIVIIVLHLFCFEFTGKPIFQKIIKGLFIFVNTILLLLNIIDIVYFKYTGKRSGWELIDMLNTSTDTKEMLPMYIVHYWYMAIVLFAFIFILFRFYPKFKSIKLSGAFNTKDFKILSNTFATIILLCGFAYARGLQTKPIRLITANRYVATNYIPLLLNTPFTILNTINQHPEKVKNFIPIDESLKYYTSLHHSNPSREFRKMNVVIIILESFGKEYTELTTKDGEHYTPFFDSLQTVGLNCSNAFANAKRSIDALPSILGGFPSLLQTSFVGSAYSLNKLQGLPNVLKDMGYATSFYHGGSIGTMGFDMLCKSLGIESYYGREDYNNEEDYDGAWGIWDEEFMQYMAANLNKTPEPFLSAVYTLTSHEPYPLPNKYAKKFFPEEPRILQTIAYTDFALRHFFATASTMNWFKNTLFVICPDHTSIVLNNKFYNIVANVSIPIVYYCPSDTAVKGNISKITQQLDIMPSILDYLNYNRSYISYGKSIFDKGYSFSVCFDELNFQIIDSNLCLLFDGEKNIKAIKYDKKNLSLENNWINPKDNHLQQLETRLKAFLTNYYFRLNNNLLADTIEINKYQKPDPGL